MIAKPGRIYCRMWQEKNNTLYKRFKFQDFAEAFEFTKKVAKLAEKQNHHPKICIGYNVVEIWSTTHSAKEVTQKDKDLVGSIDALLSKTDVSSANISQAKLFTDGGSRGNPGPSALGFIILDMEDNVVKKGSKFLGNITNNQAEYYGLIAGLEASIDLDIKNLRVYMDSLLVVNQINGLYKVKKQDLVPSYKRALELKTKFESIEVSHVPRAMNAVADGLVNECLDSA